MTRPFRRNRTPHTTTSPRRHTTTRPNRRAPLTLLLTLALLATLLTTTPALAQSNEPPIANAGADQAAPLGFGITKSLNASRSFDIDSDPLSLKYRWDVITPAYRWLTVTPAGNPAGRTATFIAPSPTEAAQYGYAITFRLTVTDPEGNTATDNVTITFEDNPTVNLTLTAMLPNPNATDTNNNGTIDPAERYTINGIINAPGQNGNGPAEWDIAEGARVTLTGNATPGTTTSNTPTTSTLNYQWRKLSAIPNRAALNIPANQARTRTITINIPDDYNPDQTAIVHYRFTATSTVGLATSATARLNIIDQPNPPTATITLANPNGPAQPATPTTNTPTTNPPTTTNLAYVTPPGATVTLNANATDPDANQTNNLIHVWSSPELSTPPTRTTGPTSTATFTVPANAPQGTPYTITHTVIDPANLATSTIITLVAATNTPPQAIAPENFAVEDSGNAPDGTVTLAATAFDPDNDPLTYRWTQTTPNNPTTPITNPTITLLNANTDTVSFLAPQLSLTATRNITLAFTATDRWGVSATDTVTITILGHPSPPVANAGPNQIITLGTTTTLNATASNDPDGAIAAYTWALTNLTTVPPATERALTPFERQALAAFLPVNGRYPNPLIGANTPRPRLTAPTSIGNLTSLQLTFTLTTTGSDRLTDTDTVTVTITGQFFSGPINSPEFCTNLSLGGPRTFAFDSDRNGVADTCSLPYTRREAVARQNALTTLASLNPNPYRSAVIAACTNLTTTFGDAAADLARDACTTRQVSAPPAPVPANQTATFFSGPITGPQFCTNLSLGGPTTYPFDATGDGVAETCSLPYTRREAIARQNALETFTTPQAVFTNAIALACRTLGNTNYNDAPADLARDACAP